ncbi:MAG: hypothetical protein JWP37_2445 [Mucilaginibacter sp.]|nr:hypothetical protein [Mucilaginibacter sp.]
MLKYSLILFNCIIFINTAKCCNADTTVMYFKYINGIETSVQTRDSADFFMLIMPPDSADNHFNIKGFYKDGSTKFVGKSDSSANSLKTGNVLLDGDYVYYYRNGKKASVMHYKAGHKDGFEYLYYPNGAIYSCMKHQIGRSMLNEVLNWECYDAKGNMICKEGNGQWIHYDDAGHILEQGPVKSGLREGEWEGCAKLTSSIKYISKYSKGKFLSGAGYDSTGKTYSFIKEWEPPYFNETDPVTFIRIFHSHLIIPKDINGRKMSLDTIYFSFIIEKDGSISNVDVLESKDIRLKNNVNDAVMKCRRWSPALCYGVPLRSKLTFGYKISGGYIDNFYSREITYRAEIIGL